LFRSAGDGRGLRSFFDQKRSIGGCSGEILRALGRVSLSGDGQPRDPARPFRHADRCRRRHGAVLHRRHRLHLSVQPHRPSGCDTAVDEIRRRSSNRPAGRRQAVERAGAPEARAENRAPHGTVHAAAEFREMKIDWDVPITMDDGLVLRADIFRPDDGGKYPALLSYGPYGKGLAFQEGYKTAWEIMARENPD